MSFQFIAGAYDATFNPVGGEAAASIGATDQGFEVEVTHNFEDIKVDEAGDAVVDKIVRGTNCRVRLMFAEYDKIKPLINSVNTEGDAYAQVGVLASSLAGELVLTPKAGRTATKIWTFNKVVPSGDITLLLTSRLRKGQLVLDVLPNSDGKFFVTTSPPSPPPPP